MGTEQTLYESRLVKSTRKGNYVIYDLDEISVANFMVSLHRLSEKQLVEIQQLKMKLIQCYFRWMSSFF
ncbi:hypothetical protein CIG75_02660 [Tumebacillus algifaecis]|uniref:HTH arsR-type domain-containing protein n=1 Tax=Tumebacillus algifaecis TaxID=1214604 RepID=A0A223CXF9_9BACL|nr:hypothetical protein CIG75_02660 [Tumebacillus algifaecis]